MISVLQFTSVTLGQALVKSIRCNLSILTHTGQTSAGWYGSLNRDCTKEEAPDEECLTRREKSEHGFWLRPTSSRMVRKTAVLPGLET